MVLWHVTRSDLPGPSSPTGMMSSLSTEKGVCQTGRCESGKRTTDFKSMEEEKMKKYLINVLVVLCKHNELKGSESKKKHCSDQCHLFLFTLYDTDTKISKYLHTFNPTLSEFKPPRDGLFEHLLNHYSFVNVLETCRPAFPERKKISLLVCLHAQKRGALRTSGLVRIQGKALQTQKGVLTGQPQTCMLGSWVTGHVFYPDP